MSAYKVAPTFAWRRRWNALLDIIFPDEHPHCRLCRRPLPEVTVPKSQFQIASVCPFCLQDAEQVQSESIVRILPIRTKQCKSIKIAAALSYTGFVRTVIRQWKYDGFIDITPWFVTSLMTALRQFPRLHELKGSVIVPVPTAEDRAKKRGYDQAYILAQGLQQQTGLPLRELLMRMRTSAGTTVSQTSRNRTERREALQGAFAVRNGVLVRGSHVLLVDDVTTTGATLQVCAEQLIQAGAASVHCLVIAYVI